MADAEKPADFGAPPPGLVSRWLAEIRAYDKAFDAWAKRGDKIIARYRSESSVAALETTDHSRKLNILWSNVQTLQPALYGRPPKPEISRTHKDKNPVARAAATILERAARQEIATGGFDEAMRAARDDYLLPGRGSMWVRYVPTYGDETRDRTYLTVDSSADGSRSYTKADGSPADIPPGQEPTTDPQGQMYIETGDPYRPVIAECVKQEHVLWSDFGHTPAPSWGRVRGVWKKERMTREQLVERFGKDKGEAITLTKVTPHVKTSDVADYGDAFKRGEVIEIWDKTSGKVLWISEGYKDGPLDEINDPLRLEGFFPCPRPLYATLTTDSLVPVADYDEYRSQAEEIDRLTQRIGLLTEALRVAGAYDGSVEELGKILRPGNENRMIKVDNWAMFAERGGVAGAMSFLPIKEIADTIVPLGGIRDQLKRDLYEITGISDIVRGTSDPNETLGAQDIKRQFVGLRISDRKDAISRFARDGVRVTAEVIAEHFSPETLWEVSGWEHTEDARALDDALAEWTKQAQAAMQPPAPPMPPADMGGGTGQQPTSTMPTGGTPQPQAAPAPAGPDGPRPPSARDVFEQAVELLRSDKLRGYTVEIETDSMVVEDQDAEKQSAIEFVTATTSFLQQAVPAVQQFPDIGPLLGELLMFAVRRFKVGQSLEGALEAAQDGLGKLKGQPPPPDPKAQAAQAQAQNDSERLKIEQAKAQSEAQHRQASLQQDGAHKQAILQQDAGHKQATLQMEQQRLGLDAQAKQALLQHEQTKHQATLAQEQQKHAAEMALKERDLQLRQADLQFRAAGQAQDMKLKVAGHNKALMDEAASEIDGAGGENEPGGEPAAPTALDTLVNGLARLAETIAAGQQRTDERLAQMAATQAKAQAEQGAQIADLVGVLAAPKRIVRGADGRAAGVETIQ